MFCHTYHHVFLNCILLLSFLTRFPIFVQNGELPSMMCGTLSLLQVCRLFFYRWTAPTPIVVHHLVMCFEGVQGQENRLEWSGSRTGSSDFPYHLFSRHSLMFVEGRAARGGVRLCFFKPPIPPKGDSCHLTLLCSKIRMRKVRTPVMTWHCYCSCLVSFLSPHHRRLMMCQRRFVLFLYSCTSSLSLNFFGCKVLGTIDAMGIAFISVRFSHVPASPYPNFISHFELCCSH
jgi:hypothetical protein